MASLRKQRILAIETSCDESAIAIADFSDMNTVVARSHIVSSQTAIHAAYGGVVPNLARREHEKNLVPMLRAVLREAEQNKNPKRKTKGSKLQQKGQNTTTLLTREPVLSALFQQYVIPLPPPDIDAIAVTSGPGLAPALWVGVNFARALAVLWHKPLIPVNHMAGHFFSALMRESREKKSQFSIPDVQFPAVALLVSGNHTELVLVKKPWRFRLIGATLDDAAGEAFDKVARILGLPYPGGPAISRLAEKGDAKKYLLPSPMLHSRNYNFSFSGLKTAALYLIRDLIGSTSWKTEAKLSAKQKADIAAGFEKAAIDVLVKKTIRAAQEHKAKTILLGGGVSANKALRQRLAEEIVRLPIPTAYYLPPISLTGDNALMIAAAAHFTGKKKPVTEVRADANVRLG